MNRVSPKLTTARYLATLPWILILAVAAVIAGIVWGKWWWLATAAVAILFVWLLWLIPTQVKRIGWRETDDELLIEKGKIFHSLTVVPYGRIQFVDVSSGPVERKLGLKTIELHTASSSSDATVPGLPADTADELRARLADKARERMSGL
ncbi:hypothetical protein C3B44_02340 [Corynebacterium yudongzhengii]|uniref:YdbS-like PH domain-containing protein n=1 Tax=Corynebacterium yudongzhengii TaxID=2080740 RepID=A0A2U1T726_9CORY|nr:PH domain-containing protein [Corynebacterium yudongzhengii]AWB81332.1 hypothetical protein C3B44_02340 [Corynebacterium yudongzhengii]PWC01775.1 hypothetical protein DF222_05425 [Corynebacterium yudongzhengii]